MVDGYDTSVITLSLQMGGGERLVMMGGWDIGEGNIREEGRRACRVSSRSVWSPAKRGQLYTLEKNWSGHVKQ